MAGKACEATSQWGRPRGIAGWLVCRIMAAKNRGMNRAAVARLAPRPGERVLEIGGGAGVTTAALVDHVGADGFVAALDHSETAVRLARKRNRAAVATGRADIRCAGVSQMPFADARFDGVIAVNNFHFWPRPESDMREVWRVLRPGGRVVIGIRGAARPLRFEFAGAELGRGRAEKACNAMAAAGFADIRIEESPLGRLLALSVIGRKGRR